MSHSCSTIYLLSTYSACLQNLPLITGYWGTIGLINDVNATAFCYERNCWERDLSVQIVVYTYSFRLSCLSFNNFIDIFAENARKRSVSDSGLLFSLFMSRFNDR